METLSTKDVANKFALTTLDAYKILKSLSDDKLITHLEPVNANKFDCCDWVKNED
jgi:hypothetical protein